MAIDLSTLSSKEAITAIYAGYFDRAPDPAGLNYWIGELESGNLTLAQIATSFSVQVESTSEYPYFSTPSVASAQAFITQVYVNLFNRGPDAAGLNYWTGELTSGNVPIGEIILAIVSGATNSAAGQDITTIENKIEAGCYWVEQAADAGINAVPFTDDPEAVQGARDALDGITDDPATVTASKLETDSFIAGYGNDDPDATDESVTALEDGVLSSFVEATDPDGDDLTYSVAPSGSTTNGTLVMNPDGSYLYTPDPDFVGTDSFTYTVDDGRGGTDTATVSITVANTNDAPIAGNVIALTAEDNAVTIAPSFTDIDAGDSATFSIGSNPTNGTVVVNANGTFTYTPNADFNGTDSFQYIVTDAAGATSIATATVTVTAVDDAPVANDSTANATEGAGLVVGAVSASDIDSANITYTLNGAAPAGLTFNNNGAFAFDPADPAYNSLDAGDVQTIVIPFTATASGQSDGGTLTITVTGTNDTPVASAVTAAGLEDSAGIQVNAIATDADADDNLGTFTYSISANASNGTVTNNNDGTFTYVPDANFNGTDTFEYTVTDSNGASSSALATVTVVAQNDAPEFGVPGQDAISASTFEDQSVAGQLTANDIDGDALTYTVLDNVDNGTLIFNANGSYVYTPNADYNGTDSFTVQVSDGNGGTDTAVVTISITPVDDVLTVAIDDISGGDGDDLFLGNGQTLNPGDSIDGGDGDDTLFVATTGMTNLTAFLTSNLENIIFTHDSAGGVAGMERLSVDLSSTTGVEDITVENSFRDIDLRFMEGNTVILDNLTQSVNTLIDGRNNEINGAADELNLTVRNSMTTTPSTGAINVDAGYETVNLDNAGATGPVTITDLNTDVNTDGGSAALPNPASGASTLNIDADDASLTIQMDLDAGITTVDATASTNNVTFSAAQGDTVARDLDGGAGNDNITGGDGADDIDGNDGNDSINAQDGNDDVSGGDGDDTLNGEAGNDTINGDDGDDVINGGAGNDDLFGGEGDDSINTGATDSVGGTEFVDAGAGDDVVTTDGGDLVGRAWFDDLDPNNTADTTDDVDQLDGGEGDDTLNIVGSNPASEDDGLNDVQDFETINLNGGTFDFTIGQAAPTTGSTVFETDHDARVAGGSSTTIDGSGAGNDVDVDATTLDEAITLIGGTGDDELLGGRGDDTIEGDGNNSFNYDGGADNMQGGDGDDTFITSANELDGTDTIEGDNGDDTILISTDRGRTNGVAASNGNAAQINANVTGIETIKVEDNSDVTNEGDLTVTFTNFDNIDNIALRHDLDGDLNSTDAVTPRVHLDGSDMDAGEDLTVNFAANAVGNSQAGTDTDIQVTGGAGDDTFNMGAYLDSGDAIVGGANDAVTYNLDGTVAANSGGDTVMITEASSGDFANVSGIECIVIMGPVTNGTTFTFGADAEAAFSGATPRIKLDSSLNGTDITINTTAFAGPVVIEDNDASNTFNLGGGDDTVITGEGDDVINGNGGADVVVVSGSELDGNDVLNLGAGSDTVVMDNSGGGVTATSNLDTNATVENYVIATDGDRLVGNDFDNNSLTFTNGDVNTLTTINVDATNLTDTQDTFTVTLDATQDDADFAFDVEGSSTGDTFVKRNDGVNNNIEFNGNDGNDNFILKGEDAGSTTQYDGGEGTDTVTLSSGQITDDGFVGFDSVEVLRAEFGQVVDARLGEEAARAGIGRVTGSAGNDDVIADSAFDTAFVSVTTGTGDDNFDFSASSSQIVFRDFAGNIDANDTLKGGTGDLDRFELLADNNTADLSTSTGIEEVRVVENGDNNIGITITNSTFTGVADGEIDVDASRLNDADSIEGGLTLNAGGVTNGILDVIGGTGADSIATGTGADTISSGAGNDTVNSGDGADTVLLGDGNDVANTGAGADVVDGGAGADEVDLGAGNDTADGGTGNDTITGGAGQDEMTGGDGADDFRYVAVSDSNALTRDTICDFDTLEGDQISIETALIFAAVNDANSPVDLGIPDNVGLASPGTSNGFNFAGNANTFSDAQGAISVTGKDGVADFVLEKNFDPTNFPGMSKLWIDVNDDGQLNGLDIQILLKGVDALQGDELLMIDTLPPTVSPIELGISENRLFSKETLTADPADDVPFTPLRGFFDGSDNDGTPVTYSIVGGAASGNPGATTTNGGGANSNSTTNIGNPFTGNVQSITTAYGTAYVDVTNGAYQYNYNNAAVEALDDGESVTDVIEVVVTDDVGNTTTTTLTVEITGADDQPTLAAVTDGSIVENGATSGLTGTLNGADVDVEDLTYGIDGVTANDNGTPLDSTDDFSEQAGTYGTLRVEADGANEGQYTYTPDNAAIETLAAGQTETDTFTVTVSDGDDGPVTRTYEVVIQGTNDAPIISVQAGDSAAETIDETDGTLTANDTLTVRDVDITDVVSSSVTLTSSSTTGVPADLAAVANLGTMMSVTPTTGLAAEVTDSNNLNWFFNSAGEAFNFLAADETATLTYTVTVNDGNGGTDTQDIVITINGTNDDPVISIQAGDTNSSALTEQAATPSAGLVDNGTLTVRDIDTTDTVDSAVAFSASGGTYAGPNTPAPAALATMFSVAPAAGLAADIGDGPGNLAWTFNSGAEGFDFLAVGETLVLTYTITVTDGNGGIDTEAVDITITGTNDTPDITVELGDSAAAGVTETVGTPSTVLSATDTLTVRDLDDSDTVTNTVTAVATATATTDGAPVAPLDAALSSLPAAGPGSLLAMMSVNGGPIPADAAPADINNITWTWNSGMNGFDFLGVNDTATLTYTITSTDNNGASDTQDVVITVTGTNDVPTINVGLTDAIGAVTEVAEPGVEGTGVTLTDTGTITFDDVDVTDTHSASVTTALVITGGTFAGTVPGAATSLGSFTVAAVNQAANTVDWTFTVDDGVVEFLDAGETIVQQATVTVDDGNGGTVTQVVEVTITGSEDTPTIGVVSAGDSDAAAVSEDAPAGAASDTLTAIDLDQTDTLAVTTSFDAGSSSDAIGGVIVADAGIIAAMTAAPATVNADSGDTENVTWTFSQAGLAVDVNGNDILDGLDGGESATLVYNVTVNDGETGPQSDQVTITVNGAHDTAIGVDDVMLVGGVNITENAGNTAADAGAFVNEVFVDVNDDATNLRVTLLDGTTPVPNGGSVAIALSNGGILTMNSNGTYSFDPNGSYEALDDGEVAVETVQLTILDIDSGTTYTTTLTINIDGVNDAPIANPDVFAANEDGAPGPIDSGLYSVLTNDTDPDIEPITAVAGASASAGGGAVVMDTDGTFTYDPAGAFEFLAVGETANDTFTYQVTDGTATSTGTVTVTVTGQNDAPTAVLDIRSTDEDTVLNVGPLIGVLSNDTDPDASDTLSVSQVNGLPANVGVPVAGSTGGLFTINTDGSYTFDPNGDFEALDTTDSNGSQVTYQVSDGNGGVSTTTATVIINGVNDAPVNTVPAPVTLDEDVATAIAGVSVADVDAGENVTTTLTVTNGTVTVAAGGTQGGTPTALTISGTVAQVNAALAGLTFTSDADYNGPASIEVSTFDGDATDVDTIDITVDPVADAPVMSAIAFDAAGFDITSEDVDGDALTFTSANIAGTPPNGGTTTSITAAEQVSVETDQIEITDGLFTDSDIGGTTFGLIQGTSVGEVISASGTVDLEAIFGFGGDDTINGGANNDYIVGGTGQDELTGNGGADTFGFSPLDSATMVAADNDTSGTVTDGDVLIGAVDVINDFTVGSDLFDISAFNSTNSTADPLAGMGGNTYNIYTGTWNAGGNSFAVDSTVGVDQLVIYTTGGPIEAVVLLGTTTFTDADFA